MLSLNINILINEFDLFFWLVYICIATFDIYRTLPDENMIIYLISGLNKIKLPMKMKAICYNKLSSQNE